MLFNIHTNQNYEYNQRLFDYNRLLKKELKQVFIHNYQLQLFPPPLPTPFPPPYPPPYPPP